MDEEQKKHNNRVLLKLCLAMVMTGVAVATLAIPSHWLVPVTGLILQAISVIWAVIEVRRYEKLYTPEDDRW